MQEWMRPGLALRRKAAAGGVAQWDHPVREDPGYYLPYAGNNPYTATPVSPSWSAWSQITAGEATDLVLRRVHCEALVVGSADWWLQLGTGASGSEAVLAEMHHAAGVVGSGAYPLFVFHWTLGAIPLPANTRLAFRARSSSATNFAVRPGIVVMALPPSPSFDVSWDGEAYAQGGGTGTTIYPAIATPITVTTGMYPWWGSWYQVIASAPNDMLVRAVSVYTSGSVINVTPAFQIGTGAAGAEAAHEVTAVPRTYSSPALGHVPMLRPVKVNSGERVAIRGRTSTSAYNFDVAIMVEDL